METDLPTRSATVFSCAAIAGILALPGCVAPPANYPRVAAATANNGAKPEYIVLHADRRHAAAAPKPAGQPGEAQTVADETGLTPKQKLFLFRNFAGQQKTALDNE